MTGPQPARRPSRPRTRSGAQAAGRRHRILAVGGCAAVDGHRLRRRPGGHRGPEHPPVLVYAVSVVFAVVLAAVVVTFLILMRHGYRWARTLLTGGGIASVVYAATSLFTVDRPTPVGGRLCGQRDRRVGADRGRSVPVAPQGRPRVLHAVRSAMRCRLRPGMQHIGLLDHDSSAAATACRHRRVLVLGGRVDAVDGVRGLIACSSDSLPPAVPRRRRILFALWGAGMAFLAGQARIGDPRFRRRRGRAGLGASWYSWRCLRCSVRCTCSRCWRSSR